MKRTIALAILLLAFPIFGATVELADGTTVTGDIQGTVVLGGETKEKKLHGGLFLLLEGKDILSISAKGVETAKEAKTPWALFASRSPLPPLPKILAVLQRFNAQDFSALDELMKMGMARFASNYDTHPIGIKVMGELANGEVAPAIRVQTADGIRTIAATDIVDYVTLMNKK